MKFVLWIWFVCDALIAATFVISQLLGAEVPSEEIQRNGYRLLIEVAALAVIAEIQAKRVPA